MGCPGLLNGNPTRTQEGLRHAGFDGEIEALDVLRAFLDVLDPTDQDTDKLTRLIENGTTAIAGVGGGIDLHEVAVIPRADGGHDDTTVHLQLAGDIIAEGEAEEADVFTRPGMSNGKPDVLDHVGSSAGRWFLLGEDGVQILPAFGLGCLRCHWIGSGSLNFSLRYFEEGQIIGGIAGDDFCRASDAFASYRKGAAEPPGRLSVFELH